MNLIDFPITLPQNHLDYLIKTTTNIKDNRCSNPCGKVLQLIEHFVEENGVKPPKAEEIVSKLRKARKSFVEANLKHLTLFGSVARGNAENGSDIDIMADFGGYVEISVLTAASTIAEKTLGTQYKVDFVEKYGLKKEVIKSVRNEGIEIF